MAMDNSAYLVVSLMGRVLSAGPCCHGLTQKWLLDEADWQKWKCSPFLVPKVRALLTTDGGHHFTI
jgi:hypothetical protein